MVRTTTTTIATPAPTLCMNASLFLLMMVNVNKASSTCRFASVATPTSDVMYEYILIVRDCNRTYDYDSEASRITITIPYLVDRKHDNKKGKREKIIGDSVFFQSGSVSRDGRGIGMYIY